MLRPSSLLIGIAAMAAPAWVAAQVPNTGQLGMASVVDVGVQNVIEPRYTPQLQAHNGASPPVVAVDPANEDLRAIGFLDLPNGVFARAWMNHDFEHRTTGGLENRPNDLTLETQVYLDGPQRRYDLLKLFVDGGSVGRVTLQTSDATRGQVSYPGGGGTLAAATDPLIAGGWRTIRLSYRAATVPGVSGTNDGAIQLWMLSDPIGGPWRQVLSVNDADAGQVRGFSIGLRSVAASAPASAYFRRLAWDSATVAPAERDTLWVDRGAHVGTAWPDGTGTLAQRFVVHYDRNLYGHGVGVTARIEYTTADDVNFASAGMTGPVTVDAAGQYTGALTVTGLQPNAQYLHRTIYTIDGQPTITTPAGRFKTFSVPGGQPGQFRFGFGADTGSGKLLLPHHSQARMASEDLHYLLHLGDINYHDAQLQTLGADWQTLATAVDYGRQWSRNMTEQSWQVLHANVGLVPIWDDHEVNDGWMGNEYENGTAAQQNMLAQGEAAANIWMDSYQPPNADFGGVKYKPDAPSGYTADNIHYFHFDTAKTRTIVLDNRRFMDNRAGSAQVLGPDQLRWAVDLLEATDQPVVFLVSGMSWASLERKPQSRWLAYPEWAAEREVLFSAALGNPAIDRVILLSGDNHYAVVADPKPHNARIGPEFLVGALSIVPVNPNGDPYEGLIYGPDAMDRFNRGAAHLYGLFDVDEVNEILTFELKNGETGDVRFSMAMPFHAVPTPAIGEIVGAWLLLACLLRPTTRQRPARNEARPALPAYGPRHRISSKEKSNVQ